MTQLELSFSEHRSRKRAGPRLAARLIAILSVHRHGLKRAELTHFGLNDRACRLGREYSHGRIISGPTGYKLLKYATPVEIRACLGRIVAQIEAEQEQYRQLAARAHRMLHADAF